VVGVTLGVRLIVLGVRAALPVSVAAACAAAPAHAGTVESTVPASLPTRHVATAAGLRITWPTTASLTLMRPGQALRVTVRAITTAAPVARIALRRLSAKNGTAIRTMGAATIRTGSFAARLDNHYDTPYVLTLDAGRLHYRTYLQTDAAPSQTAVPVPAQAGCAPGPAPVADATLTLSRRYVQPGDTFAGTLANQTAHCAVASYAYVLERRQDDGNWVTPALSGLPALFPAIALSLPANGTLTTPVRVPADAPGGTYRVTKDVGVGPRLTTRATFEVLGPGSSIAMPTAPTP
jgi:hypothetical protein